MGDDVKEQFWSLLEDPRPSRNLGYLLLSISAVGLLAVSTGYSQFPLAGVSLELKRWNASHVSFLVVEGCLLVAYAFSAYSDFIRLKGKIHQLAKSSLSVSSTEQRTEDVMMWAWGRAEVARREPDPEILIQSLRHLDAGRAWIVDVIWRFSWIDLLGFYA